ncbi:unnamed protein product [Brassicogethes aeneus]|uniref:Uncharacterized protein n=1 Tax=Brassicogethes aeneus TaxID=1431903 RepID=A0A9P0BGV8_BRAAE|nr:unnamed protein product [Brassicogethes aeneus]
MNDSYGLDNKKNIATITDNGSNFVKCFKKFGLTIKECKAAEQDTSVCSEENEKELEICSSWFTPLKHEVFWPHYKTSSAFNKALTSAEEPDQSTWKLSHVKRKFFECEDIKKAHKKLKKCEATSDIQSSDLSDFDNIKNKKRVRLNARRWSSSSNDSKKELRDHLLGNKEKSTKLPRPSGLPQTVATMGKVCRNIRAQWSEEALSNAVKAVTRGNHIGSGRVEKKLGRKSILSRQQENDLVARIVRLAE